MSLVYCDTKSKTQYHFSCKNTRTYVWVVGFEDEEIELFSAPTLGIAKTKLIKYLEGLHGYESKLEPLVCRG